MASLKTTLEELLSGPAYLWVALEEKCSMALWVGLAVSTWYKATTLTYERAALAQECLLLPALLLTQLCRFQLAYWGHTTRTAVLLAVHVFLGSAVATIWGYFMTLQIYVLRFDVVMCGISFGFLVLGSFIATLIGVLMAESKVGIVLLAFGTFAVCTAVGGFAGFYSSL
eukprot:CAMPEP_0206539176 /NCGR_PEP_ID=MMETSP0325_2-20121206/8289_1 /ASSEMBLY_ACC=CAM_ASM_000347 /TAXON_ID=2866 /ORGANISM="Crypthecodinium cohnii, Strain Seligo" /LENGTH=169 /DNA_ID=CAMNT_0054036729 /DNA_START=119 /DNA_END=624 /DNA_ORIENTATION=+